MSSTFTNVFKKALNTSTVKSVVAGSRLSSVFGILNKYKNYLDTQCGRVDSIIMSLTQAADLIPEALTMDGTIEVNIDDISDWTSLVPDDIAGQLIAGLDEAIHNNGYDPENMGVSITDSCGDVYTLIDVRSSELIEGVQPLFSTVNFPNHKNELLLWREDGKVYLNSLIRTSNFAKESAARVRPDTLSDMIRSMALIKTGTTNSSMLENLTLVGASGSTILQMLNSISGSSDSTITDACITAWNYINEQYPLPTGQGKLNSLFNVVYDLIESSTLNQWISDTISTIQSTGINAASLLSNLQDGLQHRFSAVRDFSKGAIAAYTRGGIYGVGMYILDYIKSITEGLTTRDGSLIFTDNSRLVPAQYIVGMIAKIVSSVATAATLIVSIFSRIAGAAVAVIGAIAEGILSAINFDYDHSTLSAVSEMPQAMLPTAPMALFKGEISDNEVHNDEFRSLLRQGYTLFYIEVPGGFFFFGPGDQKNGRIFNWRFEFHPSVASTSDDMIQRIWEVFYTDPAYYEWDLTNYPDSVHLKLDFDRGDADVISEIWKASITDSVFENDPQSSHLTPADDTSIEMNTMKNSFVALIWLSCYFPGLWNGQNKTAHFKVDATNHIIPINDTSDYISGLAQALFFFTGRSYFYVQVGADIVEWIMDHGYSTAIEFPSWAVFISRCFSDQGTHGYSSPYGEINAFILNNAVYFGSIECLPSNYSHLLLVPKYDRSTFWFWVVTAAITTAVVVTATILVTFKAKRTIQMRRALNQAKVEGAWSNLAKDPSAENYKAYRKAAKANNRWSKLIGGTKYDYVNYWNSGSSSDGGSATGELLNRISDRFLSNNDSFGDPANEVGIESSIDNDIIYHSIVGIPTSENP